MSALDALTAADRHGMPETVLLAETELLLEARCRLDGLLAHHLQALDARDVTVTEHGRQTKSWLIEAELLSPREAGQRMWVARRLPAHPALAVALLAGEISHDHAQVILGCLDKLPLDWREAAQSELIEFARWHDPGLCGRLCRELRVRSGADEDAEAAAQRRYDNRFVSMNSTLDGMVHLDGMLDPASAATLSAAMTPLMTSSTGADLADQRSTAQRRADALVELAALALGYANLPDHGGDRPQVMVTIPYHELINGITNTALGNAWLNTHQITPNTARMYACDAGIIPAVLGGASEVLDLGRSTPTWSRAQRRARRLTDKGCTWPGCQANLARCQIHHIHEVAQHGPTDLTNGTHLCTFHHWIVHHTPWTITRNTNGKIEVRRT